MHHLAENLKYLRGRKQISQAKLSLETGIDASLISAYEKNKSTPKLDTLLKLTAFFNRSLDQLIQHNLSLLDKENQQDTKGEQLRVLPILVDEQNEEMMTLVPVKATAGYLRSYSDIDFISELPSFRMPFDELSENKTYRAFQIEGKSMLPIPADAYIICEYVQDWELIRNGSCHVIVSLEDGVVYKRVEKDLENNQFILHSDNLDYSSYEIGLNQVIEVWKARGYVCFDLPSAPCAE